jgi:hypothetical protein
MSGGAQRRQPHAELEGTAWIHAAEVLEEVVLRLCEGLRFAVFEIAKRLSKAKGSAS